MKFKDKKAFESTVNKMNKEYKYSGKRAPKVEVLENEINIIFIVNTIRGLVPFAEYLKTDKKFKAIKEDLSQYFEQPDEVVINKVFFSESGFVDINRDSFPVLFHVTSTFFLESIKEHGLGAVSIQEKYRLEEMLDDMYNGFVEKGFFPAMKKEDKEDENFWGSSSEWINQKIGTDDDLHKAVNKYNLLIRSHCTSQTKWNYGELYLAAEGKIRSYMKMNIGEYLGAIVTIFKIYHKKTGEFFRFKDNVHQELMDSIFNYNSCEIKSSIKPVLLIIENVALSNLLREGSREKVTFQKIIILEDAYIYTGKPISMKNITVVEDLSTYRDKVDEIMEKYIVGNMIKNI